MTGFNEDKHVRDLNGKFAPRAWLPQEGSLDCNAGNGWPPQESACTGPARAARARREQYQQAQAMTDSGLDHAIGEEQRAVMIFGAGYSYRPGRRRRPELTALRMLLTERTRRARAVG